MKILSFFRIFSLVRPSRVLFWVGVCYQEFGNFEEITNFDV